MNYKSLIKTKEMRYKVLNKLSWIPDKTMLELQYFIKFNRRLNLKKPLRFSEKIQWYKLYYRDPLMKKCVDKYLVREYIKEKGFAYILNELYGVYDDANEINFAELPNSFVLKTTNGSHTNFIVEDKHNLNKSYIRKQLHSNKAQINEEDIKKQLNEWLFREKVSVGREWAYDSEQPRIVCEKYLSELANVIDYKFHCFKGTFKYMYLNGERGFDGGYRCSIFDSEFNDTGGRDKGVLGMPYIPKPDNFDEMKEIAESLASDFPYVRVDLYNIKGKIIFGELTFYDWSGYQEFNDEKFDFILGDEFGIPDKKA